MFQNTFAVPTGLTGPSQVAQHRASTFRILTSIMMRLHWDLFDEASSHESDETFWENLFIGPLNGSWHIPDHQRLRHRFGWVLDYIRDGWSIEARAAEDILREALAPNVLSCAKHPYNYDIEQPTRAFLNPDLCPKWAETFLATNGVLLNVESLVQSRMGIRQEDTAAVTAALNARFGTQRTKNSIRTRIPKLKLPRFASTGQRLRTTSSVIGRAVQQTPPLH